MHLIPAIDIINGKCVRLERGDYSKSKQYHDDPLDVALSFEDAGLKKLHLVDLDGAKSSKVVNLRILEAITRSTSLQVDFGGGIKSDESIRAVFDAGASQVTIGSIAVKDPDQTHRWIGDFGSDRIILGADVLDNEIMVSGWQEKSGISHESFLADYIKKGATQVLCTDINRDGMLTGPPIPLYRSILQKFPKIRLIASGGVASMEDLNELSELPVYGVVIGKAIYEKRITLADLKTFAHAD